MIPIALVTGFLGSGKTSFLQHCTQQYGHRRLAYIVNEFAAVDVDGQTLELPPDQLVTIPGGSIFCRCLVTEFIRHLDQLAAARGPSQGPALEGVIIEASGIADPKVFRQMLAETGLDMTYRLASIVTIIDPDTFADLLETLPNITAQVEAASSAIINKCDQHARADLDRTETLLRRINPALTIHRTSFAAVDVELFDHAATDGPTGTYAPCTDPNFGRIQITPADDLDPIALTERLALIRPIVYRVKGFIRTGGRLCHLDVSRSGVTLRPTSRQNVVPSLVCVLPPHVVPQLRPLLDRIATGDLSGLAD